MPAAFFLFRLREFYVMWQYLRNILAREQLTSTDSSRQAQLKRKSSKGVAASAALLSSAIAALGTPVASGVAANPLGRPVAASASGLAVEWAMLGAQHPVSGAANLREWFGRVGVSAGSDVASVKLADQRVMNGARSTLSGAAPLNMPAAGSGVYAGPIKRESRMTWTPVGLPADLAAQLARILAGQLDTTRPAQADDYYRIVYEPVAGNQGVTRRRVTALEMRFAGRTYRAVWFVARGQATGDYYSFDGQRLAAEPFAMPLNYVRVSSPFGYRIHPVTGERVLHTGVDLTAARGTPVVAAAAGTVQFVGVDSGYGKHVVVRHARGYTTCYAHLSAFASRLRVGTQVSEGQPLGAVGQTGVATGPHLHFEVRLNNQPTDPLKLTNRFSAVPLTASQRAAFDHVASVARNQLAGLSADIRTVSNAPVAAH
jgi:hypothetical protein